MISRHRPAFVRQGAVSVMSITAVICLSLLCRTSWSNEDALDIGAALDALPTPSAEMGYVYKDVHPATAGERTVELPLDMSAYPTRESGAAAWVVRADMKRDPFQTRETVWLTRALTPIRGETISTQGKQEVSLQWQLQGSMINYEAKNAQGRTLKQSVKVRRRLLVAGPGYVLFLRHLRPRTGTFQFEMLVPEYLPQAGLVPVTLVVSKRVHDGVDAYVGEATLRGGAFRVVAALGPMTGALRALETHVAPRKQVFRYKRIQDKGLAEVHYQTALTLMKQRNPADALV